MSDQARRIEALERACAALCDVASGLVAVVRDDQLRSNLAEALFRARETLLLSAGVRPTLSAGDKIRPATPHWHAGELP